MKNGFIKAELNKLIVWSSSRYNEYKKSDVIDSILNLQYSDSDITREYHCGSWTEPTQKSRYSKIKNMNCQGTYIFNKKGNEISLTLPSGDIITKSIV